MTNLPSGFKIADLIVKRLEGKLNAEEEQFLEKWKYAREENLVLFHKLAQNPEKLYFTKEVKLESANKEDVWRQIQTKVIKDKQIQLKQQVMKIAAMLIAAISVGGFLLTISNNSVHNEPVAILPGKNQAMLVLSGGEKYQLSEKVNLEEKGMQISNNSKELVYSKVAEKVSEEQTYNTIIIPKGGEYKLTLADGTKIWLNSNSKLRYPSQFGTGVRKVQLEGEAFFQVAKDKEHPFIVDVTTAEIKVLGTSFNVNAYNDQDEIFTTLVEGKVEVKDDLRGVSQELSPNDQLCFNKLNGKTSKKIVDTRLYTAWKDGRFVFENRSLEDIMIRLSRWYDVDVFFLTNSIKQLKYTGDVARYDNINSILDMIEVTKKVKFTIKDRSVMIEENCK
ncbi:FecR domain-containing protein [Labilibaculum sp.]|uniref:FecR family protein n=1 Tax=Labilibaculum sp. TaxID=2060723 RepID=UPI002AA94BAC|nr:FecR domain-containing protein [Labilibaculum sp.]MBN2596996.1 FecR domain-containing protein [Marinifilaceae bacterium]